MGQTPLEIAPDAMPLGSAKTRFFNLIKQNKETYENRSNQEVPPLPSIEKVKPQDTLLPLPTPEPGTEQDRTIETSKKSNWVGLSPYQLSPRSVPLGSLVYKHGMNHEMRQKVPTNEGTSPDSV